MHFLRRRSSALLAQHLVLLVATDRGGTTSRENAEHACINKPGSPQRRTTHPSLKPSC